MRVDITRPRTAKATTNGTIGARLPSIRSFTVRYVSVAVTASAGRLDVAAATADLMAESVAAEANRYRTCWLVTAFSACSTSFCVGHTQASALAVAESARPTMVRVGDPATFTLTVSPTWK